LIKKETWTKFVNIAISYKRLVKGMNNVFSKHSV